MSDLAFKTRSHRWISKGVWLRAIITLPTLTLFVPVFLASQSRVRELYQDNINYEIFFSHLSGLNDIKSAYPIYSSATGSNEPVSFMIFFALSRLVEDYHVAITLKNIALIISIYFFATSKIKSLGVRVLFLLYASTDYYLFRLLSELHKLGIGIAITFIGISLSEQKKLFSIIIAALSHFQLIFLTFIFLNKVRYRYIAIIFAAPAAFAIYPLVQYKISVYWGLRLDDALKTLLALAPLVALSLLYGRETLKFSIKIAALIVVASFFFGSDRLILIAFESIIIYLFLSLAANDADKKKNLLLYFFILLVIIPFNLFRILNDLAITV